MKYLACLGIPFLLQCLVTLIVIQAAPSGSFVGLVAMLFSGAGIPLTAIFNFALIKSYPQVRIRAFQPLVPDRPDPAGAGVRVADHGHEPGLVMAHERRPDLPEFFMNYMGHPA